MGSRALPMLDPGTDERMGQTPFFMQRYLRFGAYVLDQHRQELYKNGTKLKLQGKAYQVLLTLLERAGEIVTREELRQRLWPSNTHVNFDANVNTTVNKLRQALGDSPEVPVYIETVPRKGYSFIASVEPAEAPTPVQPSHAAVVPPPASVSGKPNLMALMAWRTGFWVTLGVAALIVVGMLLGAGVAVYWMSHAARFSPLP